MYPTFPSFRRQPPDASQHRFDTLPFSVLGFLHGSPEPRSSEISRPTFGSGLHHWLAGSPQRPAELRSLSYGPMIHLRLRSTPPHGDAVTFGYRPQSACLEGTYTLLIEHTFRRTSQGREPSLFYTSRAIGHGNAENIVHDDRLLLSQPAFQYCGGTAPDSAWRCVEQRGREPWVPTSNRESPGRGERFLAHNVSDALGNA